MRAFERRGGRLRRAHDWDVRAGGPGGLCSCLLICLVTIVCELGGVLMMPRLVCGVLRGQMVVGLNPVTLP